MYQSNAIVYQVEIEYFDRCGITRDSLGLHRETINNLISSKITTHKSIEEVHKSRNGSKTLEWSDSEFLPLILCLCTQKTTYVHEKTKQISREYRTHIIIAIILCGFPFANAKTITVGMVLNITYVIIIISR